MCWAAGTAGELRLDLLLLKANRILVIAFRWIRIGTQEQSAWQVAVCLLISRLLWCRGAQEPDQRQGGIISSVY